MIAIVLEKKTRDKVGKKMYLNVIRKKSSTF